MHRWAAAVGALMLAALASAQEASETPQRPYTQAESPFMAELPFSLQAPVEVYAEVGGVQLDTIRVDALGAVDEGVPVRCRVTATGRNAGTGRPEVSIMILLEDAQSKGLERVVMPPFRPARGRPFEEVLRTSLSGSALLAARKVFVMFEVK